MKSKKIINDDTADNETFAFMLSVYLQRKFKYKEIHIGKRFNYGIDWIIVVKNRACTKAKIKEIKNIHHPKIKEMLVKLLNTKEYKILMQ